MSQMCNTIASWKRIILDPSTLIWFPSSIDRAKFCDFVSPLSLLPKILSERTNFARLLMSERARCSRLKSSQFSATPKVGFSHLYSCIVKLLTSWFAKRFAVAVVRPTPRAFENLMWMGAIPSSSYLIVHLTCQKVTGTEGPRRELRNFFG